VISDTGFEVTSSIAGTWYSESCIRNCGSDANAGLKFVGGLQTSYGPRTTVMSRAWKLALSSSYARSVTVLGTTGVSRSTILSIPDWSRLITYQFTSDTYLVDKLFRSDLRPVVDNFKSPFSPEIEFVSFIYFVSMMAP
jgi:hypothetical protein